MNPWIFVDEYLTVNRMKVYDPKRGHYVENNDLEAIATDAFGGEAVREFTETVAVEGEEREATGSIIEPEYPFFESVAVGEVDMGSRKNWVMVEIEEVDDDKLAELLQSDVFDLEDAAAAKNRFLVEVTGYEVSDLADKVKESTRGYDSLSEL